MEISAPTAEISSDRPGCYLPPADAAIRPKTPPPESWETVNRLPGRAMRVAGGELEIVQDGSELYARIGRILARDLPPGGPWLSRNPYGTWATHALRFHVN
jgi:hypothetical protein